VSGEVSFERPAGAVVELEFAGRVEASADRVFAVLESRVDPDDMSRVIAESSTRRVVVQGGYWYRAEYEVVSEGEGATVRCAIVNVAPGSRLLGRLTGRGVLRVAPREFQSLLDEVAALVG
jgi:hypothetical protein